MRASVAYLKRIVEENAPAPVYDIDDYAIGIGSRKLQQDRLRRAAFAHDSIEISELTENRQVARLLECFLANQSSGVQANLGFLLQPVTQLRRSRR
jgi:hypothetical protein